jgi:hypothetical protein
MVAKIRPPKIIKMEIPKAFKAAKIGVSSAPSVEVGLVLLVASEPRAAPAGDGGKLAPAAENGRETSPQDSSNSSKGSSEESSEDDSSDSLGSSPNEGSENKNSKQAHKER